MSWADPRASRDRVFRRQFGSSGIALSALCFGSMRLEPSRFDLKHAVDLLLQLYDRGVTTFHSSHEYESYPLFCQAVGALRRHRPGAQLEIIAKIGVPHFDEADFSALRFRSLIESELRHLATDRVDIVQWLIRHTPNEDVPRLAVLRRAASIVTETWERLHTEGKVGALAVFPYSDAFLRASLGLPVVAGFVTYLNLIETEAVPYLDRLTAEGRGFAAIRPLYAGKLAGPGQARAADLQSVGDRVLQPLGLPADRLGALALQFPLWHPAVATVILSVSNSVQAATAFDWVAEAEVDRERFNRVARLLQPKTAGGA